MTVWLFLLFFIPVGRLCVCVLSGEVLAAACERKQELQICAVREGVCHVGCVCALPQPKHLIEAAGGVCLVCVQLCLSGHVSCCCSWFLSFIH